MRLPLLQQKCPMCDEMLEFQVTATSDGVSDDGNSATFTMNAVTTPESTAHVWTHKPAE